MGFLYPGHGIILTLLSSILNPNGKYYDQLKTTMGQEYEDNYWAEDAIFMERNSRDFVSRIERINLNAEAICQTLIDSPIGMLTDPIIKKLANYEE